MAEHGKFPSVMETSYEVPHHMGLQQQDGDKKVEHGTSPSTTAMSTNLLNNMKAVLILDSYSESSYASAHEAFSLISEESDDLPHPRHSSLEELWMRRLRRGLSLQPSR